MSGALAPILAVLLVVAVLVGAPALVGWRIQQARHAASITAVQEYRSTSPTPALEPGYLNEEEATQALIVHEERSAFADGTRAMVAALDRREHFTKLALDRMLERTFAKLGLSDADAAWVRLASGEYPAVVPA